MRLGCNQRELMQQIWDGAWEPFLQGFNPCQPQQHPQMHPKNGLPKAVCWGVFRWRFILHCEEEWEAEKPQDVL